MGIKKIFVTILLIIMFISCTIDTDFTDTNNNEELFKTQFFDEKNSKKILWDDLPEEMRKAPVLKSENSKASYYSSHSGVWGGHGGGAFSYKPPSGCRIHAIAIRAGAYIDRLTVWYMDKNGKIFLGCDRGGSGGGYYIQFFTDDEYIYKINGRSGSYIDQLHIYTNKKNFRYGGNGGGPFYNQVPSGYQILGFWGRSGAYLDQIGFYVYTR